MIQHHLLLVDGDSGALAPRAEFLRESGLLVTAFPSPDAALTAPALLRPPLPGTAPEIALVSLALSMPGGGALEFCTRLKALPAASRLRFILVGTLPEDAEILERWKALEVSEGDFLPEDVSDAQLVQAIRRVLAAQGRAFLTSALLAGVTNSGRLEFMGPLELAEFFAANGLSGTVSFRLPLIEALIFEGKIAGESVTGTPQLFFRDGRLIGALGEAGQRGESALANLLADTLDEVALCGSADSAEGLAPQDFQGTFDIAFGFPGADADDFDSGTSAEALIRHCQEVIDDLKLLLAELPPLSAALTLDIDRLSVRLADIPDEENALLRLFDGRRTLFEALFEARPAGFDALAALGFVHFYLSDGLLVVSGAAEAEEGEEDAASDIAHEEAEEPPQDESADAGEWDSADASAAIGEEPQPEEFESFERPELELTPSDESAIAGEDLGDGGAAAEDEAEHGADEPSDWPESSELSEIDDPAAPEADAAADFSDAEELSSTDDELPVSSGEDELPLPGADAAADALSAAEGADDADDEKTDVGFQKSAAAGQAESELEFGLEAALSAALSSQRTPSKISLRPALAPGFQTLSSDEETPAPPPEPPVAQEADFSGELGPVEALALQGPPEELRDEDEGRRWEEADRLSAALMMADEDADEGPEEAAGEEFEPDTAPERQEPQAASSLADLAEADFSEEFSEAENALFESDADAAQEDAPEENALEEATPGAFEFQEDAAAQEVSEVQAAPPQDERPADGIEIFYFYDPEEEAAEESGAGGQLDQSEHPAVRFHEDFAAPSGVICGGAASDPHVVDVLRGLCEDDDGDENGAGNGSSGGRDGERLNLEELAALLEAAAAEMGIDLSKFSAGELFKKEAAGGESPAKASGEAEAPEASKAEAPAEAILAAADAGAASAEDTPDRSPEAPVQSEAAPDSASDQALPQPEGAAETPAEAAHETETPSAPESASDEALPEEVAADAVEEVEAEAEAQENAGGSALDIEDEDEDFFISFAAPRRDGAAEGAAAETSAEAPESGRQEASPAEVSEACTEPPAAPDIPGVAADADALPDEGDRAEHLFEPDSPVSEHEPEPKPESEREEVNLSPVVSEPPEAEPSPVPELSQPPAAAPAAAPSLAALPTWPSRSDSDSSASAAAPADADVGAGRAADAAAVPSEESSPADISDSANAADETDDEDDDFFRASSAASPAPAQDVPQASAPAAAVSKDVSGAVHDDLLESGKDIARELTNILSLQQTSTKIVAGPAAPQPSPRPLPQQPPQAAAQKPPFGAVQNDEFFNVFGRSRSAPPRQPSASPSPAPSSQAAASPQGNARQKSAALAQKPAPVRRSAPPLRLIASDAQGHNASSALVLSRSRGPVSASPPSNPAVTSETTVSEVSSAVTRTAVPDFGTSVRDGEDETTHPNTITQSSMQAAMSRASLSESAAALSLSADDGLDVRNRTRRDISPHAVHHRSHFVRWLSFTGALSIAAAIAVLVYKFGPEALPAPPSIPAASTASASPAPAAALPPIPQEASEPAALPPIPMDEGTDEIPAGNSPASSAPTASREAFPAASSKSADAHHGHVSKAPATASTAAARSAEPKQPPAASPVPAPASSSAASSPRTAAPAADADEDWEAQAAAGARAARVEEEDELNELKSAAAPASAASKAPAAASSDWLEELAHAQEFLDTEKTRAAARAFEALYKKHPEDARVLSGLGRSLVETDPVRAILFLQRAVAKAPDDEMAWYDLGVANQFVQPERTKEAIYAYEQFLRLAPDSEDPSAEETRSVVQALREDLMKAQQK